MTTDTNQPNIQWYPGHMTRARRKMEEDLKKVDLIIEVLDARCPSSSENPEIDQLSSGKYRLVILNKADLADPKATEEWIAYYKQSGKTALALDGRLKNASKSILDASRSICREKIEKDRKRGIINVRIRAMVAGIPNVGKSTVINTLNGKGTLATADKPGVTRVNQWIRLKDGMDLIDTPGILWPKFEDPVVGLHLAWIGSINDEILVKEEIAGKLAEALPEEALFRRYGVGPNETPILERIAASKNWLMKGGNPDLRKTAENLLNDFRGGKIGRITLERP